MTDRAKIITIYVVVAILSAGVLAISLWIRAERQRRFQAEDFSEVGKKPAVDFGALESDIELVNQEGETVKLSELKDKVWVATNFFASCPNCLATSSQDLKKLYEEFRSHPDFHVVSITVNPEDDSIEKLAAYAQALNADSKNWWFLRGPAEQVHKYVEKEMKFMGVREVSPDAAQRFEHDYGLQVYARDWKRVKKKDLHYAREQGEVVHDAFFEEVRGAIQKSLAAEEAPAQPATP